MSWRVVLKPADEGAFLELPEEFVRRHSLKEGDVLEYKEVDKGFLLTISDTEEENNQSG